ncbi:conserved hypothetical protein [Nostocoides japonicum T1-X7]|uniref:Poly(3-hydroxyalkanoate) polymerase subunit PhaE n=1 Tax=Nostocoides japonicum T1-X7 TaxID=1194083 RepID=A0A077M1T3_9MICO|nr:poly(R)-hydroxyalkanoic acid synthase subunit PhaE [Tetrasphaera japonica]CCH79037.1 conserved hypothetical protein [Tetrasphaera japonica T1-X7]
MSEDPWEEFQRQWQTLQAAQNDLVRNWASGQADLAKAFGSAVTPPSAGTGGDDSAGKGAATGSGSSSPGSSSDEASQALDLMGLWRSWLAAGPQLPDFAVPRGATSAFQQIFDPVAATVASNDFVAGAIRSLVGGPQFADLDDSARRVARLVELYTEVQAAKIRFDGVVAKAWAQANDGFATAVKQRQAQSDGPLQPEEALRLWLNLADTALTHAQRTSEYLEAQGAVLRSSLDFLLAQREFTEAMFESMGAPTRSELDDVHKSVQQLKRRVRALEHRLSGRGEAGAER